VTAERVRDLAVKLVANTPAIAVVGSGRKSLKYARQAESMARN
jgi:hypothetical protein